MTKVHAQQPGRSTYPQSRWLLFGVVALGGVAFDLATKAWMFRFVGEPGSPAVSIVPNMLELRTTYNTGALWGFGNAWRYSPLVFALLSVAVTLFVLYWLFIRGAARDFWLTLGLALITAGALGNCYDRLVFGKVRDFVHFHIDPIGFDCAIFNFADNMLLLGAAILVILALRPEAPRDQPVSQPDAESSRSAESAKAARSTEPAADSSASARS
ncbi:lipoprotein signal peptidase [Isosphaera pallida ATCC 43644]|uniref:Lipoprotein signal peptidase n=1 Tax=Isosphaera pallida (strain ATCC 43644 / DSM 9630 / IS1B) TaxID=575540 RepID=E8R125_ISOPI|nr:signal peptidase II [Isosphaera pallida]ADV63376.1 lipoprotein signal peptidase [Isosphaera pallida ATCC 43644]